MLHWDRLLRRTCPAPAHPQRPGRSLGQGRGWRGGPHRPAAPPAPAPTRGRRPGPCSARVAAQGAAGAGAVRDLRRGCSRDGSKGQRNVHARHRLSAHPRKSPTMRHSPPSLLRCRMLAALIASCTMQRPLQCPLAVPVVLRVLGQGGGVHGLDQFPHLRRPTALGKCLAAALLGRRPPLRALPLVLCAGGKSSTVCTPWLSCREFLHNWQQGTHGGQPIQGEPLCGHVTRSTSSHQSSTCTWM